MKTGNKDLYLARIVCTVILGGFLFGYDTVVISGAEKGLQAFFLQARDFQYTDLWHGITCSSALLGCIIGCLISGWFSSRFGRKPSLILSGIFFLISAIQSYYPEFFFFEYGTPTLGLLLAFNLYRILGGIGVGIASAICPIYIAEISPANKRGKLVSCNQLAIILGQLVVYFVNFIILGNHTNPVVENLGEGIYYLDSTISDPWTISTGWRYMFVSEAFPAIIFTLLTFFIPESPRFLVMKENEDEAIKILTRINGSCKAQQILTEIKDTAVLSTHGLLSYGWIPLIIGILLCAFQQITGINAVLYFGPRIFESISSSAIDSRIYTVIMGCVNLTSTLLAIMWVERIGRKPLLIYGALGMAIGAIGVSLSNLFAVPTVLPISCVILYTASFMFSWGPICWVVISEIFPNTIRSKAVGFASATVWVSNFIVSSTFVPIYNMSMGDMGSHFGHIFAYSLYAVCCVLAAVFVWKVVPETKEKTLEEMDKLWT